MSEGLFRVSSSARALGERMRRDRLQDALSGARSAVEALEQVDCQAEATRVVCLEQARRLLSEVQTLCWLEGVYEHGPVVRVSDVVHEPGGAEFVLPAWITERPET